MPVRTKLPCGHLGEYIIGRFALCSVRGCDTKPGGAKCDCGGKVEPLGNHEAWSAQMAPPGSVYCVACGKVFWKGWNG